METNLRNSDTTHAPKFKSYYVVWKRKNIITDDEKEKSLNRTMQYGNVPIGFSPSQSAMV